MTAYPERADLERAFREMEPRPAAGSGPALPQTVNGPWRVVAADGSTSLFDPLLPSQPSHPSQDTGPADGCGDLALDELETPDTRSSDPVAVLRAVRRCPVPSLQAMIGRPSTPPTSCPAIPGVAPDLSELLAANGQPDGENGTGYGRAIAGPDPAAEVAPCGNRGATGPADGLAAGLDRRRRRSVFPPQVSASCRDIDSRLARIIDVWPGLPRSVQAAMLAMIQAVREDPC